MYCTRQNCKQLNNTGSGRIAKKWVAGINHRIRFGVFVLACVLLPQMAAAHMGMMYMSDPRNIKGADMAMHHMHIVMNHGMAMVAEGTNMVMTAQMSMNSETDAVDFRYGEKLIDNGKSSIQKMLSSQTMKKLHLSEHEHDALMLYTHKLGDAMQTVIQLSEAMAKATNRGKDDMMILSRIRLMLNRALKLSVEGSNMVMFGQMDMVRGTDRPAIKHGRGMMSLAHALWRDAVHVQAMKTLHVRGVENTQRYASAVKKVMDMLDEMSKVKAVNTNFRSSYNRY